jgi:alpha-galactosidase
MRDALQAQNRTILYSLCEWGQASVEQWGSITANSWRMSTDIRGIFPISILFMS